MKINNIRRLTDESHKTHQHIKAFNTNKHCTNTTCTKDNKLTYYSR